MKLKKTGGMLKRWIAFQMIPAAVLSSVAAEVAQGVNSYAAPLTNAK